MATGQAARITVQDFFLRYEKLAGMTGTAMGSARELRQDLPLPRAAHSHQPAGDPPAAADAGFRHGRGEMGGRGRGGVRNARRRAGPVLIGTRSIDKSEHLSKLLDAARHRAPGAQRQPHRGRGRDRRPGRADGARSPSPRTWPAAAPTSSSARASRSWADCTSSAPRCTTPARIDRQLIGRCGRQGDPGTLPPVPGPGRRPAAGRAGPEEGRAVRGPGRSSRPAPSTTSAACSAVPSGRSSGAISATAGR